MENPWEVIEAFEPMYTDVIGYSAPRSNNVTLESSYSACVFPIEDCEPLDDVSLETAVKKISVNIMRRDWTNNFEPQVGDIIKLVDDSKWAVSKIMRQQNTYTLTAKQVN